MQREVLIPMALLSDCVSLGKLLSFSVLVPLLSNPATIQDGGDHLPSPGVTECEQSSGCIVIAQLMMAPFCFPSTRTGSPRGLALH